MSSSSNLNSTGQAGLAVVGSVISNAVVHPLCTIKNKLMASSGKLTSLKGLYRGYTAICVTESASYVVAYVCNGWMKKNNIPSFVAATLAGVASVPAVSVGEALMINSQVNGKAFSREVLRAAMKGSGLRATMYRDVPYSVAIFALPEVIEERILFSSGPVSNTIAGVISGSLCGAITAPLDKVKTLVQANDLSFGDAWCSVRGEFFTAQGRKNHIKAAVIRAGYIGIAVGILNVINSQVPPFFPKNMRE